ncbi:MAG: phage tail protein [Oscillospiraceae bacterium]|nr:phage tail protein [Oscillospiraceae bacterium]
MIEITENQINRINTILHNVPDGFNRVIKSVIPRAQTTARAKALEQITKVYSISNADVRDRRNSSIKLRTLQDNGGIIGEIKYSGYKIPLYRFNVSPKKPNTGQPVSAAQLAGSARTPFNNAFVTQMRSGHIGIFERKGKNRFPLREIMGSSTAQMAGNAVVREEVYKATQDTIDKRIEHEISRILNGYGR